MKRKKLTVMWMPSVNSKTRVFSIPIALLYVCLSLMLVSWLLLGIGAYLGNQLYDDYVELREQNSHLQQKEKDLEAVRQTMEKIRKDENIIRNFLGLDNGPEEQSVNGQGGEPSPDLTTIAPNDAGTTSSILYPHEVIPDSVVGRAVRLDADLKKLAEAMRNQREALARTPSIIPVESDKYWFSSGFGWRRSPFTGLKEFHNGVDICGSKGTPIIAPANGRVEKVGRNIYLGKYIRIDHGNGIATTYAHLHNYSVSQGQDVQRGETIGFMGNTGRSTGTHVHYLVEVDKSVVNPVHYILNVKEKRLLAHSGRAKGKS